MKLTRNSLVVLLTLALSIASYGLVLAEEMSGTSADAEATLTVTSVGASTTVKVISTTKTEVPEKDTSGVIEVRAVKTTDGTVVLEDSASRESKEETLYKTTSVSGTSSVKTASSSAEIYRSEVAKYVQSLLRVADRVGGIGKEVREIAREKASSTASTTEAIVKVETRSKFKTFLIGSDYKNLGVIRSELAKTDKAVERLKVLASSTTSSTTKVELEAQIKLLEAAQVKVKAFVETNEKVFSLFGWFVKLF